MYIDIVVESVLKNVIYGGLLGYIGTHIIPKRCKTHVYNSSFYTYKYNFCNAMMYFTGVTINIISLAGWLGVGMLVDNSIVVIENIYG